MQLTITTDEVFERFAGKLKALGEQDGRRAMMRALNRGGDQARTQTRRSLVKQTGIKYGLINRAISTSRARPNRLAYELIARGEETNLSLFNATQRKKGVSAAPWKRRKIFKGAFIVPAYGERVFKRTSKERGPLKPLFGPNIAREVMRDPTVHEWRKAAGFVARRLEHEIAHLFRSG